MMSSSPCSSSPSTILLLLLPLVLLSLTFFAIHPYDFQLQSIFSSASCPPSTSEIHVTPTTKVPATTPTPDFRVLMGILTHPDNYERRHLIRLAYSIPDTIAVHKLKDNSRWSSTLKYFNATQGLKPSKLYHIP